MRGRRRRGRGGFEESPVTSVVRVIDVDFHTRWVEQTINLSFSCSMWLCI